ncbi:hypothetical protein A3F32_00420 [Candidatus Roizmanbacteria bacterium RIFCSPHIGHO2_12_FULL_42_10]|uniref:Bacterial toxin RNase RnlA/LsoA DBD domain-containing protein n=1 Tax=Candidatus Roizmanbacteria bacterium RIFCSPHIGHO2_12_FULL_42_10 TaxID=1802053 RepID=A0A1F7I4K0_9BACT|nr:MAG: hypothetical protein A3F32_00420 [Candidatus Roizmanbacteria bacterium RIFCSPHIGHO2_12_FULL_42_10]
MLDSNSPLKTFLPEDQLALINQSFMLLHNANSDKTHKYDDYSFTVFPIAKAYEGFLKMIFLQSGYISRADFLSKYFRIGKVMSPNLRKRLGNNSIYEKICRSVGCELSDMIWKAWKRGRNQVFHYFPNNVQAITLQEAEDIINTMVKTMETVVEELRLQSVKKRLANLTMNEAKRLLEEKDAL